MLLTGRGPSSACCGAPVEAAAPVEEATPTAAPVAEAFGFTATANDFTSNGDGTKLSWISQTDGLKALLAGGDDLQAQGDDKSVVIRGTVDTEAIKQQKGTDAQAYFGPSVAVDNQILVKAAESVTTMEPPSAAKLYFDTGKTALPSDSGTTLAPIVEWLKAHDTAKAVLSGYHDPRGNQAVNEELAKNRAKSVREYLVKGGIQSERVQAKGYGEQNPIATNDTDEGRQ